jgi:hypothetical protein
MSAHSRRRHENDKEKELCSRICRVISPQVAHDHEQGEKKQKHPTPHSSHIYPPPKLELSAVARDRGTAPQGTELFGDEVGLTFGVPSILDNRRCFIQEQYLR